MTNQPTQAFQKLREKLHEIFQLDRADLDFGIYRIMNMKREQIVQFLDKDLLPQVKAALAAYDSGDKGGLRKELDEAMAQARNLGIDPETLPKVKDLRARLAASTDATELENEVYSHLYNFFRRYYHEGDFISQRRYKEGVYAIPYEGEEVKLHWANHDQYYIKTSEYLRDYTFRLDGGRRVHFKLVEATTEKDNVKAQKGKERRFALMADEPVVVENGEAVVRFTYLPNPEKQADLNDQTAVALKSNGTLTRDFRGLFATAPTEANPNRTVLEKHLAEYTARNTFDYFIHKNLGKFLRTELDFFIKNEVLHLDDVDADGVGVEELQKRLAKIKALRRIALKLIDFLAQLEDFQKKLWLKKKFVVETSYLVTLDRIPEELYPEIAANDKQREEWVKLFAIDEIKGGDGDDMLSPATPGYSVPLTVEFLKANKGLVVDTGLFGEEEQITIIHAILEANPDSTVDGISVFGDNAHAVPLLLPRYKEQIRCSYVDPPYNTGNDGFIYKDTYQHSSWLSMVDQRFRSAKELLSRNGAIFSSIDDLEMHRLKFYLEQLFGEASFVADIVWQKRYAPDIRTAISDAHESVLCFAVDSSSFKDTRNKLPLTSSQTDQFKNPDDDPRGKWKASDFTAQGYRPNQMYEITNPNGGKVSPPQGRCWRYTEEKFQELLADNRMYFGQSGDGVPAVKRFLSEMDGMVPWTWWSHQDVGHSQDGLKEVMKLLGRTDAFLTAKPVGLIKRVVQIASSSGDWVIDFFAGSGTSAQAVLELNREEEGSRKYILVEQGDHFDTVLKPRIAKVVYCDTWKDGKPQNRNTGVSHLCKVIRLESYEDALANLAFTPPTGAADLLDPAPDSLGEDYLLRYMMEEETKGSASLLNVHRFADPTAYKLKVKAPGTDETREVAVDLLETFNWLIGLRVDHIAAPQTFAADFERDANERLSIKGDRLKPDANGPHWFRTVTGWTPENLRQPHDSRRLKVLIVWRKLTGDPEADNLVLDHYLRRQRYTAKDLEFDLIYVNGDNNLENLKRDDETWKVRLIEEDFQRLMFDGEDV